MKKFNYPSLPDTKHCYSSGKDGKRDKSNEHISNEQYIHLQNVWNTFSFNTFEHFHNHYLKKDVLLSADVFQKFISTCLKVYELDLRHYFSAPGLLWDALLKMTKVEPELAPETINIQKEWLSKYCLKIANQHNITTGTVKKLVSNLMNKNNYVIHYRNLQQYLELGMKLKKLQRVLKFKHSD